MSEKLVQLYQKMADLTAPECAGVGPGSCKIPYSCCDKLACDITKDYAASKGVTLQEYPANERGAYFLDSDKGCTVAPHLRPLCTLHTCFMNSLGFKPFSENWTRKYFKLRREIEIEHYKEDHSGGK